MTEPIHSVDLLWQEGMPEVYIETAERTLRAVVQRLGFGAQLAVERIGTWRAEDFTAQDGSLLEDRSVDFMLEMARKMGQGICRTQGQLWVHGVNTYFVRHPWRSNSWRGMSLLLVKDDYGLAEDDYIFGAALEGTCATISTFRYQQDTRLMDPLLTFAVTVFHEMGHVFGAPNDDRTEAVLQWFGTHCTNACVMRQRDDLPEWEQEIAPDVGERVYCESCFRDIQNFMRTRLQT